MNLPAILGRCQKNLVCWLMYDIDLHPLLGADKFREDFIVVTTRQVVEGY
jgi:hypothetical protein